MLSFFMAIFTSWQSYLIGAIVAGIAAFIRKSWLGYINNRKQEQKKGRDEFEERILNNLTGILKEEEEKRSKEDRKLWEYIVEQDKLRTERIDKNSKEINSLREGMLSNFGKWFKQDCYALLEADHEVITLEEFDDLSDDHRIYNNLGGNHKGDELFNEVKIKYESQFYTK